MDNVTPAERAKNRYYALKNAGICTSCGRRPSFTLVKCEICMLKFNKTRATNEPVRKELLRFIIADAKNVPCADCNHKYPSYVMDFDHVRGKKFREISEMYHSRMTVKKMREEIAKCDVVCANCHRLRTFKYKEEQNE